MSINSISVAGSGYGVPPLVMIPPPPNPGVQATAHTTITGGSVTTITLDNVGAGYIQNPVPVQIVPSPFDPNYLAGNAIVQAQASVVPIGAGSVSAVLCTNSGAVTTIPTLTIAGTGGTSATATAVMLQTLVGATAYSLGAGYTTAVLQTIGGVTSASPIWTNPVSEGRLFIPRAATELLTVSGGSIAAGAGAANGTIYDSGLFTGTPSVLVAAGAGALITTSASVVPLLGSAAGTFRLTPGP